MKYLLNYLEATIDQLEARRTTPMNNLKEYLLETKTQENNSLSVPSPKLLAITIFKEISLSSLINISNNEATDFSRKISELATSNDVITELSDEIGMPRNHETEDQFVDRAKSTLTRILKRKLSK